MSVQLASQSALERTDSEVYAGRRYYEGQQVIDQLEPLAIQRAEKLFGVDHANVQPYSGSPANLAVYLAFLEPGDTVMGMALPMGGHLTHGWGVSATGKWFRPVQYGVRRDTGQVDLDEVRDLALAERPKLIFCGGTAIPRTIDFPAFAEIAREVGAVLAADIAHIAGLIAGGAHPSPVGHAAVISTTTHKTLRGPRGAMLLSGAAHAEAIDRAVFPGLQGGPHDHTTAAIAVALQEAARPSFAAYADAIERAGIVCNYNAVPFDTRRPMDPSGIRLGTPAITTRGLGVEHMSGLARWIDEGIEAARRDDEAALERIRGEVRELALAFPPPA